MKLSVWAKKQGISYTTAWRWFRDGRLPVRVEQMATGTVRSLVCKEGGAGKRISCGES
jgi:predicted site-specific integrase-resolvase